MKLTEWARKSLLPNKSTKEAPQPLEISDPTQISEELDRLKASAERLLEQAHQIRAGLGGVGDFSVLRMVVDENFSAFNSRLSYLKTALNQLDRKVRATDKLTISELEQEAKRISRLLS